MRTQSTKCKIERGERVEAIEAEQKRDQQKREKVTETKGASDHLDGPGGKARDMLDATAQ